MPPGCSSGTCSVSRRSVSGSYSTTAGFPFRVTANLPSRGLASALAGSTFLMMGAASSSFSGLRLQLPDLRGLVDPLGSVPFRRRGRSTVTFQYPKASLGKIFDCSVSSKSMKASTI